MGFRCSQDKRKLQGARRQSREQQVEKGVAELEWKIKKFQEIVGRLEASGFVFDEREVTGVEIKRVSDPLVVGLENALSSMNEELAQAEEGRKQAEETVRKVRVSLEEEKERTGKLVDRLLVVEEELRAAMEKAGSECDLGTDPKVVCNERADDELQREVEVTGGGATWRRRESRPMGAPPRVSVMRFMDDMQIEWEYT